MADPRTRVLPSVDDTEALGRELAQALRPGDLVVLDGPLGAGKTALTRGIAAGLGVQGRVSSPTFIIARAHRAGQRPDGSPGVPMVHVDAYRLAGDLDELDSLDLDTDLNHAVVVVEWGKGVVEHLADRHLRVQLVREPESDVRTAIWEWIG
ncbi:tRNA (adenosine(37)-N6)-threonylcarbamoyltransferase complex ATPase subunit type 1 TsaE [Nocardia rosealba]|uniref:tRNA (adenosine(37)-N6)-threonylcarbamoyltransferase complex ATPase subunit type 1 TsaE n=1 Tax=Nocardia rosealba TaxID=2878563 RepID=UPI001CD96CF4|nr:tRNA (adenosine(37)-N6)-threonylcarbamoyltransferase complex ATPase subunit type 1 TsaE [Nocardia rosealba]MCA2210312.1 tRNA (adenosine(37)-N6)-threonylcarbamoyltransferase complex ATPase subunit type 1 TsaE [Nocardia rosealba]